MNKISLKKIMKEAFSFEPGNIEYRNGKFSLKNKKSSTLVYSTSDERDLIVFLEKNSVLGPQQIRTQIATAKKEGNASVPLKVG